MEEKSLLQRFAAESEPAGREAGAPEAPEENNGSNAPEGAQSIEAQKEEAAAAPPGEPEPGEAEEPKGETPPPPENGGEAPNARALLESVSAALEAAGERRRTQEILAGWAEEETALKEIYPEFDLKKEARENGEFARLLQAGVSVRRAYEAANLEAILGEAMRYAARTAGRKAAESLTAYSGRVQENSVLDRAASLSRRDVGSLTKAEILNILDEVGRGAKITF